MFMALRPGRTVRKVERPYTRVSKKVPRKSYVVGVPFPKTHQFEMGSKGDYDLNLFLVAKEAVQIRDNSLEAARIVATNFLEKNLGTNFFLKILVYPHHVLRQKSIAMGAGADRFSEGMRHSFGSPSGTAAQIKQNQRIMRLSVNKESLEIAKQAFKKIGSKISTTVRIEIEQ
jgi:large subunit ribosomal protein L10e